MTMPPDGVSREVLLEVVDGDIAVVALNRPLKRNAVNEVVTKAIDFLVKEIEADNAIRVAILTSSEDQMFSAGADLGVIAAGRVLELLTPDGGFAGFTHARRTKPWIAAVRGQALAGGCELALACDMVVAADDAEFGLPEVQRGLLAAAGGTYRLARALPRHIALELVATGASIGATRAHALGLINYMVPRDQVRETAIGLARKIAANGPLAVRHSLRIAREQADKDDAELRALSARLATEVMASQDALEGPRAFLEKRAPQWVGR